MIKDILMGIFCGLAIIFLTFAIIECIKDCKKSRQLDKQMIQLEQQANELFNSTDKIFEENDKITNKEERLRCNLLLRFINNSEEEYQIWDFSRYEKYNIVNVTYYTKDKKGPEEDDELYLVENVDVIQFDSGGFFWV